MRFVYLALALFFSFFSAGSVASDISITELSHSLNSSWIVLAGVLVFFMQAGFALVESGMSRAKNAVNVIMKNYMDVCVCSLIFWALGYGLMFGTNTSGWFGTSHFLPGELSDWDWTFLFFQMMFAATTTTIASGAMAERVHFHAYLIGACVIAGFIYPVFGSWAWGSNYAGEGWLKAMGFIDFAGSTVVHSMGGWIALAAVIILGPRLGRFSPTGEARTIPGHNLTMVALGGFILWFGWFGFNAGSTLAANTSLGKIALNTHLAACSGALGYMLISKLCRQSILLTGTVNGSLGGLVGITAGCASMEPIFAMFTGLIAGLISFLGPKLLTSFKIDDVVDAISVHGFCGAWGTLAAGLFFAGDMFDLGRISVQLIGIGAALVWGFGIAFCTYFLINLLIGMRASSLHEQRGLDFTEHAEIGYPEFQDTRAINQEALNAQR
ncbi:ammonium transporter [Cellvibrio fontiphilus]|uniref:Ammonium transporter n=1 Tax=Cellvibrio fontiphilus TaxID=1815559 RepID=A0ABV7FDU5_9GAMM